MPTKFDVWTKTGKSLMVILTTYDFCEGKSVQNTTILPGDMNGGTPELRFWFGTSNANRGTKVGQGEVKCILPEKNTIIIVQDHQHTSPWGVYKHFMSHTTVDMSQVKR